MFTSDQSLENAVLNAPIGICILDAPALIAEIVNDKFLEVAGRPYESIHGHFYWDAFPEARAYYETALAGVITSKQPFNANEVELTLIRHGRAENIFVTFVYSPILNAEGEVCKIAIWVLENTAQVTARQKVEQANLELLASETRLRTEQKKLKSFFMEAPAGICILNGPELVFELINPLYQQLFPGRDLLSKPLLKAVPEVEGSAIWDILQGVLKSGQTYTGNELLIPLALTDDGAVMDRYFDFIYQARRNEKDEVDGVLVFVMEVTKKVMADKNLKSTADTLKLAMDTANMGTWHAYLQDNTMTLSERSRLIHGIPDGTHPTLIEASEMIPEDDRKRVLDEIFNAVKAHTQFDIQYRIYPMDSGKPKWLRSTGMGYYDSHGEAISVLGTIFDITEQKEDELRKNDFIGMVSHELKTPLTTLTAIVQMAGIKLKSSPDKFLSGAMDSAIVQVKKMSKMISGFLNISRLESGKILIEKEEFEIDGLIEEIIHETALTTKDHVIHFDTCGTVLINADREKIGSVISNLLSNGIKYSPKSKLIDISCRVENTMVIVSVKDYGMGVKRTDFKKLFDRYYRVESTTTQHISGFGIGLYLSAEIIRRHDGEIWIESEYGQGSTFYFSLPLNPA